VSRTTTTYTTPEGRATRDAILDAAVRVFAARGYRGASIDAIASEVGVSRQGVLHHFPSKVQLLTGVLERRDEEDKAIGAALHEQHGHSIGATLRAGREYRAQRRGLAQLYTILSAESVDPAHPAHAFFVDRYRRVRAIFAEWVAEAQDEGRLSTDLEPVEFAAIIVAVLDGLQLQDQLEHDAVDVEQTFSKALRLVGLDDA
jgi:AcrR family transcriptional regulator